MPEINQAKAREFLSEISEKDNVAIIHHDDGDGFCSGILFYDHCIKRGAKAKAFTYSLSKTSLEELPLKEFNKIIITDVSTKAIQEEIKSLKDKTVFVTDHHPKFQLPEKVLSLLTVEQGYIPSSRTAYELVKGKRILSLIGTIADSADLYKENDLFIEESLKELGLNLEEFKTKCSHIFADTIIYFAKTPDKIFSILKEIKSPEEIKSLEKYAGEVEEEIEKYVKEYETKKEKIGYVSIYYLKPEFDVKGVVTSILGRTHPKEAIIAISEKSSNKELIGISARHQDDNANLPKLLEAATKNLPDASSGGHLRASGGQIRTKDLEKFKQNIRDYISNTAAAF